MAPPLGPWPLGPLHSLFRPELYWWRLVLILRKFCIVGVALMFSSTPLFQAWCVPASVQHIAAPNSDV